MVEDCGGGDAELAVELAEATLMPLRNSVTCPPLELIT